MVVVVPSGDVIVNVIISVDVSLTQYIVEPSTSAVPDVGHERAGNPGVGVEPDAGTRNSNGEDRVSARELHERAGARVHRRPVRGRRRQGS